MLISEWVLGDQPDSLVSSYVSQDQIRAITLSLLRNIKVFHTKNCSLFCIVDAEGLQLWCHQWEQKMLRWAYSRRQCLAFAHKQLSVLLMTSAPPLVPPAEMSRTDLARVWGWFLINLPGILYNGNNLL